MKIYIAGRITGNPHYKAQFKATAAMLQEAGHTVLNPAELPEGMKPADYMRICFAMLESADVVLFQLGWQVSKGQNWSTTMRDTSGRTSLPLTLFHGLTLTTSSAL